jgi:hypothetical protein
MMPITTSNSTKVNPILVDEVQRVERASMTIPSLA